MNLGRAVFAQLISFLPDREFRRCVSRYDGDHRVAQLLRLGSVPIDGFRPADLPRKDLVAWIIPKNVLSLVFSTLGVVQMPHKFNAARRHKFDKVQYRVNQLGGI